jgi:transposase-like protein
MEMSQEKRSQQFTNGRSQYVEPDPEVIVTGKRRRYSQAYKLRVLAEAAQCQQGETGALLRREGLYHSTLSKWRQQQAEGKLDGRRAKAKAVQSEQAQELKRLQRENARLQARLEKAEAIIEVQKKLARLLGLES